MMRRSLVPDQVAGPRLERRHRRQCGCCTLVLHVASSSRSQVAIRTASAAARLTWERPSANVRGRPPVAVAVVTHLDTQSLTRPWSLALQRPPVAACVWKRAKPALSARNSIACCSRSRVRTWVGRVEGFTGHQCFGRRTVADLGRRYCPCRRRLCSSRIYPTLRSSDPLIRRSDASNPRIKTSR